MGRHKKQNKIIVTLEGDKRKQGEKGVGEWRGEGWHLSGIVGTASPRR